MHARGCVIRHRCSYTALVSGVVASTCHVHHVHFIPKIVVKDANSPICWIGPKMSSGRFGRQRPFNLTATGGIVFQNQNQPGVLVFCDRI